MHAATPIECRLMTFSVESFGHRRGPVSAMMGPRVQLRTTRPVPFFRRRVQTYKYTFTSLI